MNKIIIVSCGKAKRSEPSTAEQMYTSSLFKLSRQYARKAGDAWYILSAKCGLILPGRPVTPYEQKLSLPVSQSFGYKIARQIASHGLVFASAIEVIGGRDYVQLMTDSIVGHHVSSPVAGMGLFERMKWLSANGGAA